MAYTIKLAHLTSLVKLGVKVHRGVELPARTELIAAMLHVRREGLQLYDLPVHLDGQAGYGIIRVQIPALPELVTEIMSI